MQAKRAIARSDFNGAGRRAAATELDELPLPSRIPIVVPGIGPIAKVDFAKRSGAGPGAKTPRAGRAPRPQG